MWSLDDIQHVCCLHLCLLQALIWMIVRYSDPLSERYLVFWLYFRNFFATFFLWCRSFAFLIIFARNNCVPKYFLRDFFCLVSNTDDKFFLFYWSVLLKQIYLFMFCSRDSQRHGLLLIYDMGTSAYQNFDFDLAMKVLHLLKVCTWIINK